ncbi:hypothetical protein CXG81DRAFT_19476 [Caulochytrium protostelioides]|uniref:Uncharacterized protein n=1 Tax=Caulochytrium protostelioides TaxID=1555241 RepID=A0A4P9WYS8_9FUNG|nr:hypothetical protein CAUPRSCDRAFT_10619 [Caulochytrium protostelioides]RKP00597.1 hypothetical protein CXG81DRAFT_19476 [Caulochytrium protostelioides]|eukprot:RKP00597.1 hypothetical protein CXG81DRAFT_19476 [Caulochytrium protostelioides]
MLVGAGARLLLAAAAAAAQGFSGVTARGPAGPGAGGAAADAVPTLHIATAVTASAAPPPPPSVSAPSDPPDMTTPGLSFEEYKAAAATAPKVPPGRFAEWNDHLHKSLIVALRQSPSLKVGVNQIMRAPVVAADPERRHAVRQGVDAMLNPQYTQAIQSIAFHSVVAHVAESQHVLSDPELIDRHGIGDAFTRRTKTFTYLYLRERLQPAEVPSRPPAFDAEPLSSSRLEQLFGMDASGLDPASARLLARPGPPPDAVVVLVAKTAGLTTVAPHHDRQLQRRSAVKYWLMLLIMLLLEVVIPMMVVLLLKRLVNVKSDLMGFIPQRIASHFASPYGDTLFWRMLPMTLGIFAMSWFIYTVIYHLVHIYQKKLQRTITKNGLKFRQELINMEKSQHDTEHRLKHQALELERKRQELAALEARLRWRQREFEQQSRLNHGSDGANGPSEAFADGGPQPYQLPFPASSINDPGLSMAPPPAPPPTATVFSSLDVAPTPRDHPETTLGPPGDPLPVVAVPLSSTATMDPLPSDIVPLSNNTDPLPSGMNWLPSGETPLPSGMALSSSDVVPLSSDRNLSPSNTAPSPPNMAPMPPSKIDSSPALDPPLLAEPAPSDLRTVSGGKPPPPEATVLSSLPTAA